MAFDNKGFMKRAQRSHGLTIGAIIVVAVISALISLGFVGVVIWAIIKLVCWATR